MMCYRQELYLETNIPKLGFCRIEGVGESLFIILQAVEINTLGLAVKSKKIPFSKLFHKGLFSCNLCKGKHFH